MKKIIITTVCVIASFAFGAKAQNVVIDEFPYQTGYAASDNFTGWTITGTSANNGSVNMSSSAIIVSPELNGAFMTVSVTQTNYTTTSQLNLEYSYDGINFFRHSQEYITYYQSTFNLELPFGTKYIRIQQQQGLYNSSCNLTSVTITNVESKTGTYKNITWTINSPAENGELVIEGTGNMPDSTSTPWYEHRNGIRKLTIANTITSIGNNAFRDMLNLKAITLSNNITRIGDYAFYGCQGPTSLYIPNSVTSIGNYAFYDLNNLDYISFGTGLKSVGKSAFASCAKLTTVRFYATDCRTFGNEASPVFKSSTNLNTFFFANNIKTIPDYMFASLSGFRLLRQDGQSVEGNENSNYIEIPPSVKVIGKGAFLGTDPSHIYIPTSVDTIGAEAFRDIEMEDKLLKASQKLGFGAQFEYHTRTR